MCHLIAIFFLYIISVCKSNNDKIENNGFVANEFSYLQ